MLKIIKSAQCRYTADHEGTDLMDYTIQTLTEADCQSEFILL